MRNPFRTKHGHATGFPDPEQEETEPADTTSATSPHGTADDDDHGNGGASWSDRNSYGVSSALALAPAGAGEDRRQGAPDQVGEAERGPTQDTPRSRADTACPACGHRPPNTAPDEEFSWRDPDDPPLLAPMYRKRTKETRSRARSIRFTPTAERVIEAAARAEGKYFSGYVGDAAYAKALGRTGVSSPEDDPARPLVEALEVLVVQLRRTGNNLNQITHAINSGLFPEHAEGVLARVEDAIEDTFLILDGFVGKEAA